jgi:hypothetical protein
MLQPLLRLFRKRCPECREGRLKCASAITAHPIDTLENFRCDACRRRFVRYMGGSIKPELSPFSEAARVVGHPKQGLSRIVIERLYEAGAEPLSTRCFDYPTMLMPEEFRPKGRTFRIAGNYKSGPTDRLEDARCIEVDTIRFEDLGSMAEPNDLRQVTQGSSPTLAAELTADQAAEVDRLLMEGQFILAIKEVRSHLRWELKQAADFVRARRDRLRQDHAELFARLDDPPPPPVIDPAICKRIVPAGNAALRPVLRVLRKIEGHLDGGNYSVTLDLKVVDLPSEELPMAEVMVTCYPESRPNPTMFSRVSPDEMRKDVEACFGYESEPMRPALRSRWRAKLDTQLIPAYWLGISQLITRPNAAVYAYSDETGLPGYHTFWFFAYLIHAGRRCVVVTGKASD